MGVAQPARRPNFTELGAKIALDIVPMVIEFGDATLHLMLTPATKLILGITILGMKTGVNLYFEYWVRGKGQLTGGRRASNSLLIVFMVFWFSAWPFTFFLIQNHWRLVEFATVAGRRDLLLYFMFIGIVMYCVSLGIMTFIGIFLYYNFRIASFYKIELKSWLLGGLLSMFIGGYWFIPDFVLRWDTIVAQKMYTRGAYGALLGLLTGLCFAMVRGAYSKMQTLFSHNP